MRGFSLTVLLLGAGVASASDFEFCALTGAVASESVVRDGAQHFAFHVTRAEPAKCGIAESYRPENCRAYQGKRLEIALPASDLLPPEKDALLTLIQRVWYAELADDPGYRIAWQRPGNCQARPVESGQ